MKLTKTLMLLSSSLLLGCTTHTEYRLPIPDNHPEQHQKYLQSVRHWDVVAEDIVKQSIAEISKRGLWEQQVKLVPESGNSPFIKALNNFLINHLVNKGANVSTTSSGRLSLRYNVQVIRFNSARSNITRRQYLPGSITALTAGALVVHEVGSHLSGNAAILGGAALADIVTSAATQQNEKTLELERTIPEVEIIVTTSLVKDSGYVMRRSDIYYISDPDQQLYDEAQVSRQKEAQVSRQGTLMDAIREYDLQRNGRFD